MSRKIGLLIGNGSFGAESGFAQLRCPPQDVEGMRQLLTDEVHGGYDEVRTLVDTSQREIHLALLAVLRQTVHFEDKVVVYYSGHGSPDEDGRLFLAASDTTKATLDATGVALDYVVRCIRNSKSQQVVLILDCCFSGRVEQLFTRGEVADQVRTSLPQELSGSGFYVLTASNATQLAEEREGDQYGLLTKHILSGIAEGHADLNDDGIVTMHELTVYVQEAVKREGQQEPLGFTQRAGGGEFELARTGRPAMAARRVEVEAAIWRVGRRFRLPMEVVQHNLGLISQEALEEDERSARLLLAQMQRVMRDSDAFMSKLWQLYEQAHPTPVEPLVEQRLSSTMLIDTLADAKPLLPIPSSEVEPQQREPVFVPAADLPSPERWAQTAAILPIKMTAPEKVFEVSPEVPIPADGSSSPRPDVAEVHTSLPSEPEPDAIWIERLRRLPLWTRIAVPGVLLLVAGSAEWMWVRPRRLEKVPSAPMTQSAGRNADPAGALAQPNQVSANPTVPEGTTPTGSLTHAAPAKADEAAEAHQSTPTALARYSYRTPDKSCEGEFVETGGGAWIDHRPGANGCPDLKFQYTEVARSGEYIYLQLTGFKEFRRLPILSQVGFHLVGWVYASSSIKGPWSELWPVNLYGIGKQG